MTDDVVYSPAEVAALLRIHSETVYLWLADGKIPGRKVGGLWIIPVKTFHEWLDGGIGSPNAEEPRDGIALSTEVGRPVGGGDLVRPEGQPDDDRALREEPGPGGKGRGRPAARRTPKAEAVG